MTGATGHAGAVMHIREHLQERTAVNGDTPLVAHVVFARRPSRIIPAGKITVMTALAGSNRRLGNSVSSMTVETPLQVAGVAVFLPEVRIKTPVAPLHKLFLPLPLPHGVVKNPFMPLMAADTTDRPPLTGGRITAAPPLTVARPSRQTDMSCGCIRTIRQKEADDEEHHPTHDG